MNENDKDKEQDKQKTLEQRTTDLEEDMNLAPEHIVDDDMKAGNTRHRWVKIVFPSDYTAGDALTIYHKYGRKPILVLPAAWEKSAKIDSVLTWNRDASTDTELIVRKSTDDEDTLWAMLI